MDNLLSFVNCAVSLSKKRDGFQWWADDEAEAMRMCLDRLSMKYEYERTKLAEQRNELDQKEYYMDSPLMVVATSIKSTYEAKSILGYVADPSSLSDMITNDMPVELAQEIVEILRVSKVHSFKTNHRRNSS